MNVPSFDSNDYRIIFYLEHPLVHKNLYHFISARFIFMCSFQMVKKKGARVFVFKGWSRILTIHWGSFLIYAYNIYSLTKKMLASTHTHTAHETLFPSLSIILGSIHTFAICDGSA